MARPPDRCCASAKRRSDENAGLYMRLRGAGAFLEMHILRHLVARCATATRATEVIRHVPAELRRRGKERDEPQGNTRQGNKRTPRLLAGGSDGVFSKSTW